MHALHKILAERSRPKRSTIAPGEFLEIEPDARGAVVVAAGDGLTAIFATEGAIVVGRNPSTAEFLAAVAATRAGRVVLLPNDANTHAVASAAAREAATAGIRVSVVPTRLRITAMPTRCSKPQR